MGHRLLGLGSLAVALSVPFTFVMAACGSDNDRLASVCQRPRPSLSPSEQIDCAAAGYFGKKLQKQTLEQQTLDQSQPPNRASTIAPTPAHRILKVGSIQIVEHPRARTVVFEVADPTGLVVRPGTCHSYRLGRGYHLTYTGEAEFSFAELRRATFALERHDGSGNLLSCFDHQGRRPLRTNSEPAQTAARARWSGSSLRVKIPSLTLDASPASDGRYVAIDAVADAPGNGDEHAHLRRGTCRKITGGEWPLLLSNYVDGTERAEGHAVVHVPFARIAREPWVFEIHYGLLGADVDTCVRLDP
jgi:hypothetical protein